MIKKLLDKDTQKYMYKNVFLYKQKRSNLGNL